MFYFALVAWALGEVRRAVDQIDEALRVAVEGGHVPTLAYANVTAAVFAAICRNPDQVALQAETSARACTPAICGYWNISPWLCALEQWLQRWRARNA
jgi:hypothetical protein